MLTVLCSLLLPILLLLGPSTSHAAPDYGPILKGRTTFYGGAPDHSDPNSPSWGTLEGSCGSGLMNKAVWPFWHVGALANTSPAYQLLPTRGCGTCWRITCSTDNPAGVCWSATKSTTIVITDNCPECKSKNNADFDIQALIFASMADPKYGSMAIEYQQVSCSPPGGMVAHVTDTRGPGGWSRFGIENVAGVGGVAAVQVQSGSTWVSAVNKWGGMWEVDSMPGPGPYDLRVTLLGGAKVSCPRAFLAGAIGRFPMSCQANGTSNNSRPHAPAMLPPHKPLHLPPLPSQAPNNAASKAAFAKAVAVALAKAQAAAEAAAIAKAQAAAMSAAAAAQDTAAIAAALVKSKAAAVAAALVKSKAAALVKSKAAAIAAALVKRKVAALVKRNAAAMFKSRAAAIAAAVLKSKAAAIAAALMKSKAPAIAAAAAREAVA